MDWLKIGQNKFCALKEITSYQGEADNEQPVKEMSEISLCGQTKPGQGLKPAATETLSEQMTSKQRQILSFASFK